MEEENGPPPLFDNSSELRERRESRIGDRRGNRGGNEGPQTTITEEEDREYLKEIVALLGKLIKDGELILTPEGRLIKKEGRKNIEEERKVKGETKAIETKGSFGDFFRETFESSLPETKISSKNPLFQKSEIKSCFQEALKKSEENNTKGPKFII